MNNAEYHRHPAVGKSHLDAIARSPLHYWARYIDPSRVEPEPTAAMQLGTAFHTRILEPELFAKEYALAPAADRRTKDGKAAWADAAANGATLLSAADWDMLLGMDGSVRRHVGASRLLARAGAAETTHMWVDADTGIECKCRPDYLTDDGWVIDLKTTEDASPRGFAKSVATFRYHVQAAWYLDGVRATGHDPKGFVFIAVEKKPPYAVAVYSLDYEALGAGASEARRCLQRIAECRESDSWPGYDDAVQLLSLPAWAKDS
jgi:exodeoxyribonuclease VIII